jgi:hypothetical protein
MRAAVLAALLLLAACGVPQELPKQAEEVQSIAAEGALLAHGAADGSATDPYVREHARALRRVVEELLPAIEDARLVRTAASVSASLALLAAAPDEEPAAAVLERELEAAAAEAAEIAG